MPTDTDQARPAAQKTTTAYHWIITVQFGNGMRTGTYDGSVDITPGINTRSSVYADLRKHMAQVVGTDQLIVLFFDLQPNRL